MDVLNDAASVNDGSLQYDLLLDKGTFDAISLMEDFGPAVRERYLKAASSLLKKDGLFVIATCNWTIDEIGKHMATRIELILNRLLFPRSIMLVLFLNSFRFSQHRSPTNTFTPVRRQARKQSERCRFPKRIKIEKLKIFHIFFRFLFGDLYKSRIKDSSP